ncbi:hypothetical protein M9Y10_033413 [Tritrichomonas musculus]|uniref:Spindle and kinetochore-associated protein 1 n=1 Tax=Tritrichomonas musculus TaxID=1915356 RepID=A0ABR2KC76_9EUKA
MDPLFSLQLLSQRVYEIQLCISCAINGCFKPQAINQLNNKMSQIEDSIRELENFVSQLPDVNEIYQMIEEMKNIYEVCSKAHPEIEENLVNNNLNLNPQSQVKQNVIRTTNTSKSPRQINNNSNVRSSKLQKSTPQMHQNSNNILDSCKSNRSQYHQFQQDPIDESEENVIIQHVSEKELSQASKSVNYRIPIDKLNTYISELNEVLTRKMSIVKLQPNQVKASVRRLWERYKDEELMDDDRLFFTQEDVKETATMKNNSQKVLAVLQALGRVSCSTDQHVKRYFVK